MYAVLSGGRSKWGQGGEGEEEEEGFYHGLKQLVAI